MMITFNAIIANEANPAGRVTISDAFWERILTEFGKIGDRNRDVMVAAGNSPGRPETRDALPQASGRVLLEALSPGSREPPSTVAHLQFQTISL